MVGRRELTQFRDMTVDISERVRALIADGKTLDEVMAARTFRCLRRAVGKSMPCPKCGRTNDQRAKHFALGLDVQRPHGRDVMGKTNVPGR